MNEALWALGRGTGIVALVLFTAAIVLGIVARSGRAVAGMGRFGVAELHRTASLTGTGLIVVHVVTLMLDPFAQLRIVDAVVPFIGRFKPLWQGLGTVALDLLLVIVVVSLLRDRLGPRVFRTVHWATYALWPIALAHSLGNGTNGTSWWLLSIDAVCVAAVLGAVAWRLSPSYAERGRRRTPRLVGGRAS